VKTILFNGLKGDEKENFKISVRQSKNVLDKYREIVYNMLTEASTVASTDYDNPSWSHKQAHTNGFCEALRKVDELLNIESPNQNG